MRQALRGRYGLGIGESESFLRRIVTRIQTGQMGHFGPRGFVRFTVLIDNKNNV